MMGPVAVALAIAAFLGTTAQAQYYQPCCGGVEIVPPYVQQNRQYEAEQAQRRLEEQQRQIRQMQEEQERQRRESGCQSRASPIGAIGC